MNAQPVPGKLSFLNLAAAGAGMALPSVFVCINAVTGGAMFTAGDLVFSVFLGAALAANIIVWTKILCKTGVQRAACENPAGMDAASTRPPHPAARPVRASIPVLPVALAGMLATLRSSGHLALEAPLSGLDSTLPDLQMNIKQLPEFRSRVSRKNTLD